jgi:hypothetical protein
MTQKQALQLCIDVLKSNRSVLKTEVGKIQLEEVIKIAEKALTSRC